MQANPFAYAFAVDDGNAPEKLVLRDAFLAALTLPDARAKTVEALWDKSMLDLPHLDPEDEAVRICANASKTGLAMTTVLLDESGSPAPLHIFHAAANENRKERTVLVGGSINADLGSLLKSTGLVYVDNSTPLAAQAVDSAVQECFGEKDNKDWLTQSLCAAFLLRNGAPGEEIDHIVKTPGELMTGMKAADAVAPLHLSLKRNA